MPIKFRNVFLGIAASAAILAGQQAEPANEAQGTALKLVPSEPLVAPSPRQQLDATKVPAVSDHDVRPAILNLRPAGDPIYLIPEPPAESEGDKWRTYRRPKVELFSRNSQGVAIQGYDAVSYQERRAEKGLKDYSVDFGGVSWYFATADHRDLFRRDPQPFLPEYGGFCAYSVGRGYPATADPRAYAVESGRLFLFFDRAVQAVWRQDQNHLVTAADRCWPRLHW